MKILYFDTETSDLVKFKERSAHPDQPHLIELGWITEDMSNPGILDEQSHYGPAGCPIAPGAAKAHGITTKMLEEQGKPYENFLPAFIEAVDWCDGIVCHNVAFDMRIMKIHCLRHDLPGLSQMMESKKLHCTMSLSTSICKIPKARGGGYKWPKLMEAYQILVSPEGFENAHEALADVKATREVFHALVKLRQDAAQTQVTTGE